MNKKTLETRQGELNAADDKLKMEEHDDHKRKEQIAEIRNRVKKLSGELDIPTERLPLAEPHFTLVSCEDLGYKNLDSAIRMYSQEQLEPAQANNYNRLDSLDYFIMAFTALAAVAADFVLVGLPPKNHLTPTVDGGVIQEGYLASAIKSWNCDSDNKLAKWFKVPFDKATTPGILTGLNPNNHRFHTFAHDPSPFGFIAGMFDIARGTMSGTTLHGEFLNIPTGVPADKAAVLLAPITWLGHLVSDVATKMGLPVPGSSIFQLITLKVPAIAGNPTVADVVRQLYLQGFDCRHYLVGGIVPGLIEIFIRLYHFLRYSHFSACEDHTRVMRDVKRDVEKIQLEEKLNSMLFFSHAFVSAANAGRVMIQGMATQNPFEALRNVNLAQWQIFALRAIQFARIKMRDKACEDAVLNRQAVEENWTKLRDLYGLDDSENIPDTVIL